MVVGFVLVLVEADIVEDKKLGLRTEISHVAHASGLEILFSLAGDVTRVSRVGLFGDWINDIAQQAQRRHCAEWVYHGSGRIRDHQHVRSIDGLPATDRRTIKAWSILKDVLFILTERDGEMLPGPDQIHE